MIIPCPHCDREVQLSEPLPKRALCPWCNQLFEPQEVQQREREEKEVWEISADDTEPPLERELGEVLDEEEGEGGEPLESEGGPKKRPRISPQEMAKFFQFAQKNISDPMEIEEDLPELPEINLELQEDYLSPPPEEEDRPEEVESSGEKESDRDDTPLDEEADLEDLLLELSREESAVITYYLLRRDKEFGPFSEEEIAQLIERNQIIGDEKIRRSDSQEWVPIVQSEEFGSLVRLAKRREQKLKEKLFSKESESNGEGGETGEFELVETSGGSDSTAGEGREVSAQGGPVPLYKRRWFLYIAGGAAILTVSLSLLLLVLGSSRGPETSVKHRPTISLYQLAITDDFSEYKRLFLFLKKKFSENKYDDFLLNVRFLFYLFDSYGEDRELHGRLKLMLNRLYSYPISEDKRARVELARAIFLKDRGKIAKYYRMLRDKLSAKNPESAYLAARSEELLFNYKRAEELYKEIIRRFPRHIRALLALYRLGKRDYRVKEMAPYLLRAVKFGPEHLPAQLEGYLHSIYYNTWLTRRRAIRNRILRAIEKKKFTPVTLARWFFVLSEENWRKDKFERAAYFLKKAIALAPDNRLYRWRRVQFALWRGDYTLARTILKDMLKKYSHPQLEIWYFETLLHTNTKEKLFQYLEANKDKYTSTPLKKYLFYLFVAKYYAKYREWDSVIEAAKLAKKIADVSPPQPYISLLTARAYLEKGRHRQALKVLESLNPKPTGEFSARVLFLKGRIFVEMKDFDTAQKYSRQLMERYPHLHYGALLAGEIFELQKKFKEAAAHYRRALLFHYVRPSPVLFRLARVYIQLQNPTQALTVLERYRKDYTKKRLPCEYYRLYFWALEELGDCKRLLALKLPRNCEEDYSVSLRKGSCALNLGDFATAERELKTANAMNPRKIEPLLELAKLYRLRENYRLEKQTLSRILDERPHRESFYRLLKIYRMQRLFSKAKRLMRRFKRHFGSEFEFQLEEATLYYLSGRRRKAERLFAKLEETEDPNKKVILLNRRAELESRRKRYQKALSLYEKALEINSKNPTSIFGKAKVLYSLRNYSECRELLLSLFQIINRRDPLYKRAELLQKLCSKR